MLLRACFYSAASDGWRGPEDWLAEGWTAPVTRRRTRRRGRETAAIRRRSEIEFVTKEPSVQPPRLIVCVSRRRSALARHFYCPENTQEMNHFVGSSRKENWVPFMNRQGMLLLPLLLNKIASNALRLSFRRNSCSSRRLGMNFIIAILSHFLSPTEMKLTPYGGST